MKVFKQLLRLLFYSILLASAAQAGHYTMLTHSIRPFTYVEQGEIKGFAVEIVREMMRMVGHTENFHLYPFKRALVTVQNTPNHALFIVARTPDREQTVKWVGPLISSGVYFYKKREAPIKVNNLEEAKNLPAVGVGLGNADHTFLKAKGFTNLVATTNQIQSIKMLYNDRIAATPISEIVMPEIAKQAGIDANQIERTDIKLYDSVLYLVFSKDTPDEVVANWQQALDELKSSGEYQQIYNKYVH